MPGGGHIRWDEEKSRHVVCNPNPISCPLHKDIPDLERCEMCQELHAGLAADAAPLPGFRQAFPVTAPLCPDKLDVMDVPHPSTVQDHYEKFEDQHAKYHFDRNQQQELLEIERRKLQRQKQRTAAARREADKAIDNAVWQVSDAKQAVEDRRRRAEQQLQALEVQVRQADILYDETKRETQRRLVEAQGLQEQEEAHLADVAELLRIACENTASAQRRYQDLEASCLQRQQERDQELEKEAEDLAAQEKEALSAADARIMELKERNAAQLKSARAQADAREDARAKHLELENKRTLSAEWAAERRRAEAQQRLDTERNSSRLHVTAMSQDCESLVGRAKYREEATHRKHEAFEEGSVKAMNSKAEALFNDADRKDLCTKVSLQQTSWVLGHHFKTRWNYTPTVDNKVTNVMQGTLHDRILSPHMPPASPRTLKPPSDLPQLTPRLALGTPERRGAGPPPDFLRLRTPR